MRSQRDLFKLYKNPRLAVAVALVMALIVSTNPVFAVIAVPSETEGSVSSNSTITLSKPSGLQVGDLMLSLIGGVDGSAAGVSMPSGWSSLASNSFGSQLISYKYADSGDVAASNFTWNMNNVSARTGGILRITGAKSSAAFTVSSLSSTGNTANPSFSNGVTPAAANSLIVINIFYHDVADPTELSNFAITTSNPGGWTASVNLNTGFQMGVAMAHAVRTQTTGTGAYSASTAGDSTNAFRGWILAIASALPPSEPTTLWTEGQVNPSGISDTTPEFSAIYNDDESSDSAIQYNLQVSTTSAFTSTYWDSGTSTMATTTQGSRSPDISYAGSPLTYGTTYYWRIRFTDTHGYVGSWSTTTSTFSITAVNQDPIIQNISFTYDAVGNITQIVDNSTGGQGKTISYEYDDLHRLVTASTTAASSTSYRQTYTYDAIGNITNKSDIGSYTYAGTSYANPHAPTTIASTTYSYDNDGNLTSAGSRTYTWDFLNRLLSAGTGTATTTNVYDDTGKRVKKTVAGVSTIIANDWFSKKGASTTITALLPDGTPVAIIEADNIATSTYYVHTDHLGSVKALSNGSTTVVQVLDYYPYGSERISTGSDTTDRHYIGERYDAETELNYLNARYYESARGQFLSQDPVFWEIGQTQDGKAVLRDPQLQNSYSYARNNPIVNKDPQGRCPVCVPIAIGGGVGFIGGIGTQAFSDYLTGDFGNRSFSENLKAYSVAGTAGATVGAGTVVAGAAAAAAGLSTGATALVVGGTSGVLTAGTSVAGDRILGQQTDLGGLGVSTGISAISAGTLSTLPKVVGRWPNLGTKAFFTGQHTQRFGAEEFVSGSMQSFGQTAYRTSQSFSSAGVVSQLQSIVSQLQSIVKDLSAQRDKKNNK